MEDAGDGCQSDSGIRVPAFEQECEQLEVGHPSLSMKNTSGWADVSTTLHNFDEDKVKSNNENIDTLLVFVSTGPSHSILKTHLNRTIRRLACSLLSSPHSLSRHASCCSRTQPKLPSKYFCKSPSSSLVLGVVRGL